MFFIFRFAQRLRMEWEVAAAAETEQRQQAAVAIRRPVRMAAVDRTNSIHFW